MDNLKISSDIKPKDFISIRESVKWNKINYSQVEKALKNSMFNISIFIDDYCVGMGRVVGDNVLKGMLTDIIIRPEYQGKGIGKIIVTSLIKQIENKLEENEVFQLEASPTCNKRDFYIKCGFKYKPENQDGVYLWIKK
ncbi:MAG: GNAT family N-acetyltransferase [Bacilli bacterium]|nr:GNAT family N-acetyltransferase [Bacilli bacterium]